MVCHRSARRAGLGLVVALAMVIAGGGCSGEQTEQPTLTEPTQSPAAAAVDDDAVASPGFGYDGSGWPEGIPPDIPVLDGEITNVMSDSLRIRMFYSGVSDDDLAAYLAELEQGGFDLEYVVYQSEVNPGRAEERAAAGEWDAVRAGKGDYELRLEFGGGTGTFDVSGISMDDFGPNTSWPSAWAAIPAPTGLKIVGVVDLGVSGPLVECEYQDEADIDDYVGRLEAAGFSVTNRAFDQNDDLISVTAGDNQYEVLLRTYPGGRVNISVSASVDAPGVAPGPGDQPHLSVVTKEFPSWLPEVPGGDLITATDDPGGGFTAVVMIGEGHTVGEYVEVLIRAGFDETGETMLAGFILSKGERRLTIYGNDDGLPPLQIMIKVDP